MANINKLEMGKTVSALPSIEISKSLFGLVQTAIYKPTGSKLQIVQDEYTSDNGTILVKLLNTGDGKDKTALLQQASAFEKVPMGNFRLDACVSADHQFVAMQLFQFSNLLFRPVTDVKVYEGDAAKQMASIL